MMSFRIFRAGRCFIWCLLALSMFVYVTSLTLENGGINEGSRASFGAQSKFIPSKKNGNFATDMISGAVARACAQIVVFPVDCIKTRLQARGTSAGLCRDFLITNSTTWLSLHWRSRMLTFFILVSMPRSAASLLRGALSTSVFALPTGAIQFSVFPWTRRSLRLIIRPTTLAGEARWTEILSAVWTERINITHMRLDSRNPRKYAVECRSVVQHSNPCCTMHAASIPFTRHAPRIAPL